MKKMTVLFFVVATTIVAFGQKIVNGKMYFTESKISLFDLSGKLVTTYVSGVLDPVGLVDGMYIVFNDTTPSKVIIQNGVVIGMDTDQQDQDESIDRVHKSASGTMNAPISKLIGDYYIYSVVDQRFNGTVVPSDTLFPMDREMFSVQELGYYVVPDPNIRIRFAGKNSRAYAPSATSFRPNNVFSTLASFNYHYTPNQNQGIHRIDSVLCPLDSLGEDGFCDITKTVFEHTYTTTAYVSITLTDTVITDAIYLLDTVSKTSMVLCKYVPPFTVACTPVPYKPKPQTIPQLKNYIRNLGPMQTLWDTILNVRLAAYKLQNFALDTGASNFEISNLYGIPIDSILRLYANGWGGLCGNYATFFRKVLHELYGVRSWEFSIGIGGNPAGDFGGHVQTLVEYIRPLYDTITPRDTSYYLMDADYNTHYIDSSGNPLDLRDQINLVANFEWRKIFWASNTQIGPNLQKGPCEVLFGNRWVPASHVEKSKNTGNGLFKGYYVRILDDLATQQDYQNISQSYPNLESQGFAYTGNPDDFGMSILWFRGLYGGPDVNSFENRIFGWLHSTIAY